MRRSPRLPHFDYSSAGAVFVTFCTAVRGNVLGTVVEGDVRLSSLGELVAESLAAIPVHAEALVDCSVVMPDHVHAVIVVHGRTQSLPTVVSGVKARVTRLSGVAGLWQRSFHDHVVRDESDLARIREYIATNPLRWHLARGSASVWAGQVPPLRQRAPLAGTSSRPESTSLRHPDDPVVQCHDTPHPRSTTAP